ncbi:MAG: PAS domain S-box protein [Gemmatimonadaceae bacterium]|nr:PAS domain S-box protein [Gemmatimonadaceae bacterium]
MIRLTALGRASLSGPDATDVHAVLAQPKRLALLAYIALSPGQCATRERLASLFWEEADEKNARGALRKALHFLRERLGANLFDSDQGNDVKLNSSLFWCDAIAFSQEMDAGNYETALGIYQGDLLPECWLEEAAEFERWIERKREDLRDSASAAALKLSEAEFRNDNIAGAMFWAGRAEILSPYNEQITARVISLLNAAGDRSAALRKYADLTARLKKDFDSEPSPETAELIEAIRGKTRPGLSDREANKLRTPITGVRVLPENPTSPIGPAPTDPLRRLVEDAVDVIFTTDNGGHCTYVNKSGCSLLGLRKSEIVGRLFVDFVRADFRIEAVGLYLRQVQQMIAETYFEFPVISSKGETVWLGQHVRLRVESGKPAGTEAIARDITAVRRLLRTADRLALVE